MSLEDKLRGWTGPSSETEQAKQERTERMVREAIDEHVPFNDCRLQVFAKGSYANNTNVRAESDVDIAVQCTACAYWEEADPGAHPKRNAYRGDWTPARLRDELARALREKFSSSEVDASGSTAIRVHSNSSRIDADVVPCFTFKKYYASGFVREGTKIFKRTGGSLVNYPAQQLENGRAKNQRTNHAYKKTVRILKRVHNLMVSRGDLVAPISSYLIECLPYNCEDAMFYKESWTEIVREVLIHVWNYSADAEPTDSDFRWLEVNECLFLFHSGQEWKRNDVRIFAEAAWRYLEIG